MLRVSFVIFVVVLSSASFVRAQSGTVPAADPSPPVRAAEQAGGSLSTPPPTPAPAGESVAQPAAPAPSVADTPAGQSAPAVIPAAPAPSPAVVATPVASPRELFEWAAQTRTEQGYRCSPHTALVHEGLGYVACGTGGVWVCGFNAARGWALQELVAVQGMVVGLRLHAGEIQAEVVHPVPVPLRVLRGSPAAGAAVDCDSLVEPNVSVDGLVVTLDPQGRHCLNRRQHVELLDADGRVLAVGRVAKVRSDVRLTLGYHERVPAEQVATVRGTTARLTSSRIAPQRAESMWLARVHARPMVSPAPAGGILGEVSVEHVFRRKAFLRAEATPLAIAAGDTSNFDFTGDGTATVGSAFAGVLGGLDTRLFALGAGIGVVTVNEAGADQAPGSGTAFPLFIRMGARDGLSVEVRGDATLFLSSLRFTGVFGKLNVPITHATSLQLQGGGGPMGVSAGYFGLRKLARGNGGPGSLFWETSIGGGSVFREVCERPSNASEGFTGCFTRGKDALSGMTLGFGLEGRF